MEDELYLENIDEFVTDQNRIVSPAGRAARGAGGRRRCATPPQEGETPPHLPLAWLPFEGGVCQPACLGDPLRLGPRPSLGVLELGGCVCAGSPPPHRTHLRDTRGCPASSRQAQKKGGLRSCGRLSPQGCLLKF